MNEHFMEGFEKVAATRLTKNIVKKLTQGKQTVKQFLSSKKHKVFREQKKHFELKYPNDPKHRIIKHTKANILEPIKAQKSDTLGRKQRLHNRLRHYKKRKASGDSNPYRKAFS